MTAHQGQLETTLAQLVSFPSVSSNSAVCHEIIEFIREELAPYNLFITSDLATENPWLIATTKDSKEPDIMLAAHLDVVPATSDLFAMQKHDGKLYGRGVYDMKHAAACYLELLRTHIDELRHLNIGFMFTTDEETGGDCLPVILESGWRPKVVFIPDAGDNWQVEARAKGIYAVEIVTRGKNAHASRPWEGESAIDRLLEILHILRISFPSHHPDDATLAITVVKGGDATNQIASRASARIDFRTFSKHDIAVYKAQLEQLALKYDFTVTPLYQGAPLIFDKKHPAVQQFLRAFKKQTGKEVAYCESYGGSDARYFAQYDIPCIIVEPHGGGRHATDEWILADDLSAYYQLLERWIFSPSEG